MKFIKENLNTLLTILFLVLIGILLLVDPATFGITIIKVAGVLFAALGVFDLVKYFRADPAEAARIVNETYGIPADATVSQKSFAVGDFNASTGVWSMDIDYWYHGDDSAHVTPSAIAGTISAVLAQATIGD